MTLTNHFRSLVPALAALMAPALVALTCVGASAVDWPTSYAQYNLAWDGGEMPKPTTYPSATSWQSYNTYLSANGWFVCTVKINNDSAIIGTVMLRNPADGTWTDLGVPGSGFPFKYDWMDLRVNNLGTVAITLNDSANNPSGKEVMAYRRVGDTGWTAPTGTTQISQAWQLEYNGNRFLAGRGPSTSATNPEAGYWNTDGSFTNVQSILGGVGGNVDAISGTKGWGIWGSSTEISTETFHFSVLSGIGGVVTATEVLFMGTPAITKTVPLPQGGTVAINNVHDVAFVGDYAYINSHSDPAADDPAFAIKIPLTTIATDWSGAVAIPRPRLGDASMSFRGANTSGVVVGVGSPFLGSTTFRDETNQTAFVYTPTSGTVELSSLTGNVGYALEHLSDIAEDGAMSSGPNLYVPVPTVNLTGIDTAVGPSDMTATVRLTRPTGTLGSTLVPLTCNLTVPVGVTVIDTPTIPVGQASFDVRLTILNTVYGDKTISLAIPTIPGGNYYNQAGNAYNRGSNQNVVITNANVASNPTPTLTRSGSGVTASFVDVTVSFDEAVNGFDVNDITGFAPGALSNFAGSGTSYSFRWTPPASGTGSVSLSIQAAAANAVDDAATSLVSNTITISYDTQAPTVSTPDLASGSDLGTPTDNLTADNTPTFTGTAEADATVSLFVDAVLKGTAVATGGSWSITSSTLTDDGAHDVTASAQDAAGNSSAVSAILPIIIDTVVAVAITTSPASTVTTGTPTWSGTCDTDATIAVSEGSTSLGAATSTGPGTWSFTPASALADGNHTLVFTATDAAGATATTTASVVLVDAVGPVVALAGSDLIGQAGESITLTATYSDAGSGVASISLVDNTGLTVTPSGSASATVAVSGSGTATRTITLTDLAGDGTLVISVNAGTALDGGALAASASNTVTVTVDSTVPADPTITLANASNSGSTADLLTNVVRPTVNGVTDSGTTVTIREGSTVLGTATVSSTTWTFTPTADLGQGLHTLTATATDAAGNASAATALGVTIDTQITIAVTAASITTSSSSPTFSGTTDANETVTITGTGFTTMVTTANGAGVWSVAGSGIAAGTYALTVTASDAAANSASTSLALTIDQSAPTAPTTSASVLTNDTTPTLSGTAESGATITIAQGATVLGTATATGGAWTFTLTTPLAEGVTTLTITATDSAGNVSTATTVTVTIDVTAPGAPTAVAPGTVTTATPTLTGTAEAGATVVIKEGATVLATVTANGSGAWTATLTTLANGLHTLAITAQDDAGNISSTATTTVTVSVPAGSSSSSDSSSGKCGFGSGTSASLLLFMSGLMFLRRRRKESV